MSSKIVLNNNFKNIITGSLGLSTIFSTSIFYSQHKKLKKINERLEIIEGNVEAQTLIIGMYDETLKRQKKFNDLITDGLKTKINTDIVLTEEEMENKENITFVSTVLVSTGFTLAVQGFADIVKSFLRN